MKNFKKLMFGLAALVLVFGLALSVSAFKSKSTPKSKSTTAYVWQKFNRDGSANGGPVIGTEISPFLDQCQGEEEVCAVGMPLEPEFDPIILRYEEQ